MQRKRANLEQARRSQEFFVLTNIPSLFSNMEVLMKSFLGLKLSGSPIKLKQAIGSPLKKGSPLSLEKYAFCPDKIASPTSKIANTTVITNYLNKKESLQKVFAETVEHIKNSASDFKTSMQLMDNLKNHKIPPNCQVYEAMISSCEKAGQWKIAISLLKEMKMLDLPLSAGAICDSISACEKNGLWDQGFKLLRDGVKKNLLKENLGLHESPRKDAAMINFYPDSIFQESKITKNEEEVQLPIAKTILLYHLSQKPYRQVTLVLDNLSKENIKIGMSEFILLSEETELKNYTFSEDVFHTNQLVLNRKDTPMEKSSVTA